MMLAQKPESNPRPANFTSRRAWGTQGNSPESLSPPSGTKGGTAFHFQLSLQISCGIFHPLACETSLDAAKEYCKVSAYQRLEL